MLTLEWRRDCGGLREQPSRRPARAVPGLAPAASGLLASTQGHLRDGQVRGLPAPLAGRLSAAANAALAEPALRERLEVAGVDPGAPSTPDSTRALLEAELTKFRDIVAQAGLRLSRG